MNIKCTKCIEIPKLIVETCFQRLYSRVIGYADSEYDTVNSML